MATTKITNPELFDLGSLDTALKLPSGTTAERPTSPSTGEWRYNTDTNLVEFYDGGAWRDLQSEDIPPTPSEHFNTVLYSGNSSTQAITGVGFQPDWVWIKERGPLAENHNLTDSTRGTNKILNSNNTNAEITSTSRITSFDSDGFTVDDGSDGTFDATNGSGDTYVSWNWKAGGTAVSNTDGSITSQVSAAPEAGFSIISWTGSGADGNIGHGLTQTPEFFMTKDLNNSRNWEGFHKDITAGHVLYLNLDIGQNNAASTYFQGGYNAANDTTIALSSYLAQTGRPMIGYAFHSVDGYSKVGKYVGNNSADGSFSYTGFRPAFVIIKRTDSTAGWVLYDNKRDTYNQMQFILWPNLGNAEYTSNLLHIDFLSNGFKVRNDTYGETNASGGSYIYLAFAEAPFKYANAR